MDTDQADPEICSDKKTPLARGEQGVEGQGPFEWSLDDNPARIIQLSDRFYQPQGASISKINAFGVFLQVIDRSGKSIRRYRALGQERIGDRDFGPASP